MLNQYFVAMVDFLREQFAKRVQKMRDHAFLQQLLLLALLYFTRFQQKIALHHALQDLNYYKTHIAIPIVYNFEIMSA